MDDAQYTALGILASYSWEGWRSYSFTYICHGSLEFSPFLSESLSPGQSVLYLGSWD